MFKVFVLGSQTSPGIFAIFGSQVSRMMKTVL